MYNLAHIYIYDKTIKQDINKAIKLLLASFEKFYHSGFLLSVVLIKQFGFDIEYIKHKLMEINGNLTLKVFIEAFIFSGKSNWEFIYENYQYIDFLYNVSMIPVYSINFKYIIEEENSEKFPKMKDISQEFYDGFGHDLA